MFVFFYLKKHKFLLSFRLKPCMQASPDGNELTRRTRNGFYFDAEAIDILSWMKSAFANQKMITKTRTQLSTQIQRRHANEVWHLKSHVVSSFGDDAKQETKEREEELPCNV